MTDSQPLGRLATLACRALDAAPIGLVIVAPDARCLAINRTLATWSLRAPSELAFVGEPLRAEPPDAAALSDALRRALAGESAVLELEHAPLLERPGRFRLHVMPFRDEDGAIAGASVVYEDITEHVLAAEAFEASERRFRTLVDGASDGIAVHRNGVVLYVNPAGVRMLGYESADEIVGCQLLDFVPPELHASVLERIAELGRLGRLPPREETLVRKDGTALVVEAAACRVPLDDGLANFVFFRDVTERKQLEAELSRTSRMESLGRLAGGIAHDFNNLLGIIQGSLEIARLRREDAPVLEESLESAEAASRRAAEVTRQLLTFSRGDQTSPMLLDPNVVIDEAVGLVRGMTGHKAQIEFEPNPDAGQVWMGSSQLHQVLLNLLLNARDAIAPGGTIRVTLERRHYDDNVRPPARAGDWVLLRVWDNGSGMTAATRARIFEPFFTTKAPGQGTGLGLSTVYGIVRQIGGFIEVQSAPGKGTCFDVHLPAA